MTLFSPMRRRLIAGILLLCLLIGAVAPALSSAASQFGEDAVWVEMCTAAGMRWERMDLQATQADPAGGKGAPLSQSADHEVCPFCSSRTFAPALPMQPPLDGGMAESGEIQIVVPRAAKVLPHRSVWAAARPRAPPFSLFFHRLPA